MDLRVNNYESNNYRNTKNIAFGKIIPIKKVLIDGVETTAQADIKLASQDLIDVLLNRITNPNGDEIRTFMAKKANDYTIPQAPIHRNFIMGDQINHKLKCLLTGPNFKKFTELRKNYLSTHQHLDKYEDTMNEEILKLAGNPESKVGDGEGLVLHTKREYYKHGFNWGLTLTKIEFEAMA